MPPVEATDLVSYLHSATCNCPCDSRKGEFKIFTVETLSNKYFWGQTSGSDPGGGGGGGLWGLKPPSN